MEGGAGGQAGWGSEVRYRAEFFYADDRPVSLKEPVWLQGAFENLTGLFNRVGICKNVQKTVGMI